MAAAAGEGVDAMMSVLFSDGGVVLYPDDYGGWKRRGRSLQEYLDCDCGQPDCWVPSVVAVAVTEREAGP
jgi:hypothetical protein